MKAMSPYRWWIVRLLTTSALSFATASHAAAPQVPTQAPGFYRMMLGAFEVTALLDGTHAFPVDDVMTGVSKGETHRLLADADLDAPLEGSINAFLINTGARLILIDSGAGTLYGTDGGHLIGNLRASGYEPEQIDDVYLTHLHRDHVGGVNDDGKMVFPNAIVHAGQADADYWLDRNEQSKAPAFLGAMFDGAIESLAPYRAAGRFAPIGAGGAAPTPGVRVLPTAGHTPGHMAYIVESGRQKLLVWGDVVHVAAVQFPHPRASVKYDSFAASARARRAERFEEAARDGYWVAAAHISFPGIGHVRRRGGGFEWVPANYTTAFTKH